MAIKPLQLTPSVGVPDVKEPVVPEVPAVTEPVVPDKYTERKAWWTTQYEKFYAEPEPIKKKKPSILKAFTIGDNIVDAFKNVTGISDPGKKEFEATKEQILAGTPELKKSYWFMTLYNNLPGLLAIGTITSYEEYTEKFGVPEGMTENDVEEAMSAFDDNARKVAIPDWLAADPEKEAALDVLFASAHEEIPPNTIQKLTVDAILQQLAAPRPSLPEGMTDVEILEYLAIKDLPPESISAVFDVDMVMDTIVKADLEQRQMIEDVINGIKEWKQPDQSTWDRLFFSIQSPMQSFADFLAPYMRNVSNPMAGIASMYVAKLLPGTQGIEENFNRKFYGEDKNVWSAYGEAFEEWDLSWYYKLGIELVTDPITYIPGVGLSVPGRMLNRVGLKTLGSGVLGLNKGIWAVTDIPFDAAKHMFSNISLKTSNQIIQKSMDEFAGTLNVAVTKVTGKAMHQFTRDDLALTLTSAVKAFADTPNLDGNVLVDLGRYLSTHEAMSDSKIYLWSRQHGGTLTENVPAPIVSEVNQIITDFTMRVNQPLECAKRLANSLQIDSANLPLLAKEIKVYSKKLATDIDAAIQIGKSSNINAVTNMMDYLLKKQKSIITAEVTGKQASGKMLEGIALGLRSKVDAIDNNRIRLAFDRWLVKPFAEANLASIAYPLWNAFEGIGVSLIEGVTPGFVKYEAANMMCKGLVGVPKIVSDAPGILGSSASYKSGAISFLPGAIPEQLFGYNVPKSIAGKDWLEWTGRKWIKLSEIWGNAIRVNYITQKMAQHLAEMAYTDVSGNIIKSLSKGAKNAPKVDKKSLGLSTHELEQEMFRRMISSRDDVLALKEVLTDGSLMRGEIVKILREANLLSPRARALADQLLDEGGLFRAIPVELEMSHGIGWRQVSKETGIGTEDIGLVQSPEAVREFISVHDEALKNVPGVKFPTLFEETTDWILHANNDTLQNIGKIASSSPEYRAALHNSLMKEYPTGYIRIFRGQSVPIEQVLDREFVNTSSSVDIARTFQDTWPLGTPGINDILIKVDDVIAVGSIRESELIIRSDVLKSRIDSPIKPAPTDGINEFVDKVFQSAIEDLRQYPIAIGDSFRYTADIIAGTEITKPSELLEIFTHYEVMSESAAFIPHRLMSQIMEETDQLYRAKKFGAVRSVWEKGRSDMLRTTDEITASLSAVRAKLLANAGLLKPEQRTALETILERAETSNIIRDATLREDGRMLDEFWSLPKGSRTPEAHRELRAKRAELWSTYRNDSAIQSAGEYVTRRRLSELYHNIPRTKQKPIDATNRPLTSKDVADLFGTNVDGLANGLLDTIAMHGKEYFIQLVKQTAEDDIRLFRGFTESKIGQVYDNLIHQAGMSPEMDILTQKILMQGQGMKQRLASLKMTHSLSPQKKAEIDAWIDNAAATRDKFITDQEPTGPLFKPAESRLEKLQEKLGVYQPKVVEGKTFFTEAEWTELRQKALDLANKDYYKAFADYTNENMVGATMKMIYPYWNYHQYRWFSLSRQALRHPGLPAAWGKYQDYSENGFVPSWFPNLEMNPFVGSVLGTTFTLTRSDYASYYEQLGWAGEVMDYTQRWGYYPNAPITAAVSLLPMLAGRKPELGGILPPIGKTGLDLLVASNLPGVSKAATWLKDNIFHENFHDYYTATILDSMQVDAGGTLIGGQTGTDLWFKKLRGEKLTDEEQSLWDAAYRKAAEIGVLRSQFPMFRLRTEDYKEAYDQVTKIFEEQLGMSEEFQKELWKNHLRPTDVVGGLPLNVQAALDELWQWKTYFGRSTILVPPEVADLKALIDKYWNRMESYQQDRISRQLDIDTGFLTPTDELHFSGKEWRSEFAANWSDYANSADKLETEPEFADAVEALTPEGQLKLAKRLGYAVAPDTPLKEAINLYFSIELETKKDPYTGDVEEDFLTFWMKREAVRRALTPEQLDEFDNHIRKYQSPMELTFHHAYNTYIRGYKSSDRVVFNQLPENEKQLVKEYYADTTTLTRKEEIRSLTGNNGRQIIAGYESARTEARTTLRQVSPTLDFWLYVFGYTSTLQTPEARVMVDKWEADKSSILINR